jgi:hypothetical protein
MKEFKNKTYLLHARNIVLEGVKRLQIKKDEQIKICRGYVLTSARETLIEKGYDVIDAKITGITQKLVEEEFLKSLVKLGIGCYEKVKVMRSYKGFLTYVLQNLDEREKYVKTGWRRWERIKEEEKNA